MNSRNTALGNYYDFLKTGNMQGFDIAASTYKDIMSEYKSYFTSSKDILKPMDMMDITRGLLFRLAENGHIEKNMSLIGTSQSFLSSIFLDRPENIWHQMTWGRCTRDIYKASILNV